MCSLNRYSGCWSVLCLGVKRIRGSFFAHDTCFSNRNMALRGRVLEVQQNREAAKYRNQRTIETTEEKSSLRSKSSQNHRTHPRVPCFRNFHCHRAIGRCQIGLRQPDSIRHLLLWYKPKILWLKKPVDEILQFLIEMLDIAAIHSMGFLCAGHQTGNWRGQGG